MSSCGKLVGYQCEFTSPVSEDFLCKKCNFVARKLSATTCCGESYCYQCISDISQQGNPCPECHSQEFTYIELIKYQKRINSLEVYCSMKERGCDWSGTIDQLDTHLDPDLDNCQYVDTKCPLNCQQLISRNKLEQHVAQECLKRSHVCQHCGYEATHEEVEQSHLPECKYVALQCPNLCGVCCDREDMEDHRKICLKEEIDCVFRDIGCKEKFPREYEENHKQESLSNHLSLTTAECIRIKEELLEKDFILQKHEDKIQEQEQQITGLKRTKKELSDKVYYLERKLSQLFDVVINSDQLRLFQINNFSTVIKESDFYFKSPIMCTQTGVKFFISIQKHKLRGISGAGGSFGAAAVARVSGGAVGANARALVKAGHGAGIGGVVGAEVGAFLLNLSTFCNFYASAHAITGECDDDLSWPLKVEITLEIVKKREQTISYSIIAVWNKPDRSYEEDVSKIESEVVLGTKLGRVSDLKECSVNDILHFRVADIRFAD